MWQYTATNGTNFYLVCFGLIEIPPHEATPEKPSFLLFGIDCCSPTKAAYLPTTTSPAIPIADYRRELIHSLISAGKLACQCVVEAQKRYKFQYDKHYNLSTFNLGIGFLFIFHRMRLVRYASYHDPGTVPIGLSLSMSLKSLSSRSISQTTAQSRSTSLV